MRVVVVGATGNIGISLVERLAFEPGVSSVVGVARRKPQDALRFAGSERVSWSPLDIRYDALEPVVEGADAVVHLAWMFQPTHRPEVTWSTNAAWTARALPADPKLFDAVMALPVMSNARAKSELGWQPTRSAEAVLEEFLAGLRRGEGEQTVPLAPSARGG